MTSGARLLRETLQDKGHEFFVHIPVNSRLLDKNLPTAPEIKRAAFLDRDGVIVEDVHFLRKPSEVRLLSDVAESIREIQKQFYIIVVTNQSGIARGLFDEAMLLSIHENMLLQLLKHGANIDAIFYCPHLPDAKISGYNMACQCRKPKPGMINMALNNWDLDKRSSFLVGDSMRDVEAASLAGVEGFEVMKNGVGECDDRNKWRNLPEVFHGAVLNRIGLKNS
ncbi:HAD family hydrolase [Dehalococcoidia bacterium]|nr:HAD family hydrolase [Dehalococcoidia bacterium]